MKSKKVITPDSESDDDGDDMAGIRMENLDFEDYGDEGEDDSGSIEDIASRIKNDDGGASEDDDEMSGESEGDDDEGSDSDTKEVKSLKKSLKPVNTKSDEAEAKKEAEDRKKKKKIE